MPKTNIRRLVYHVRHRYLTMNNIVIAVAFLIAASWAWGSIGVMQRNYALQKEVDAKKREQQLVELETANLAYEQRYYKSDEYKKLAVRERLGLADPGEKVLILPPNTATSTVDTSTSTEAKPATVAKATNAEQWLNFLFGGIQSSLQK